MRNFCLISINSELPNIYIYTFEYILIDYSKKIIKKNIKYF